MMVPLGNDGTDLRLRKEINRFLFSRDQYSTAAFVRWEIERGEVCSDVDPGLFRLGTGRPEKIRARIDQVIKILRGATGGR